jgi:hypothetical protein
MRRRLSECAGKIIRQDSGNYSTDGNVDGWEEAADTPL